MRPPAPNPRPTSSSSIETGLAVSLTVTLADNFGSGAVLPGTGIVLNNALQWFNPEPGSPVSIVPGVTG